MEDIHFTSEGDLLHGVLLKTAEGPASNCAVIIAHGAFDSCSDWLDYANRLAETGRTVLALDFSGHGTSEGLRGMVDLRRWAYNLRDAMNALGERGYQRFALVGWNSGGSAVLLAAAHDPRLACAVGLSVPVQLTPVLSELVVYSLMTGWSKLRRIFTPKPLLLSRTGAYTSERFAVDDGVDRAYRNDERLHAALAALPVPESLDSVWMDISAAMPKIAIPVLIVHGVKDEIIPVKQAKLADKLLKGKKKLILVEDAGHVLHLDQKKDEVLANIDHWIDRHLNKI